MTGVTVVERDDPAEVSSLVRQVDVVGHIRLAGAPQTLLLDTWALLSPEGHVQPSLAAKVRALAQHEGMRLVVLSGHGDAVKEALPDLPHLVVASSAQDVAMEGSVLAIMVEHGPLPPHAHAWYVGPGRARSPFHATRHTGVSGTDEILGLFGTALVQERAGIAFRAAGAGKEIPGQAPFDEKILDGIARALANYPRRVARLAQEQSNRGERALDQETERLIASALPSILECQDENGAVAAAPPPRGPNAPNYWFFWQRDAGQVIIALTSLAQSGIGSRFAESVRSFIARYVDFVARLPQEKGVETGDLGVSRFEMSGQPVRSYGNPQKDGPACTVLAVLAALGESERAYTVVKPYLEYLREGISGPSFDPWEFAVGQIFFDCNLARQALRRGGRLAASQGDAPAAERYGTKADEIEQALEAFKSPSTQYLLAGRNFLQPFIRAISHLDIDVVGSILTAYDVRDTLFNVDDPLVVETMKALERICAERWPVNVAWQKRGLAGMGMGRFPEDANDGIGSTGGNPWTFATLWAAQYYFRMVQRRDFVGAEDVDGRQRADLLERADGYLQFVLSHAPPDALTEQIDGQTGAPRGAKNLAWAQAALIQTLLLRREVRKR